MILEHADIRIDPAQANAFEEAIDRAARTVISKAKGFQDFQVNRSVESPGRYLLTIHWDTLEDHTVSFRESPAFAEWRAHRRPVLCGAAGGGALRAGQQELMRKG
jgi:heme-degrading monooxygenase HmoA